MENFFLDAVVADLRARLDGASVGRIWQPNDRSLVLDLRLADNRLLFVSADPTDPGLFLTESSHKSFESQAGSDRAFGALLRKRLRGAAEISIAKTPKDRVVWLDGEVFDAGGDRARVRLVIALTGRTSNVYLLDADERVLGTLRALPDESQLAVGGRFALPDEETRPSLGELSAADVARLGTHDAVAAHAAGLGRTLREELEARAAATSLDDAVSSLARDIAARRGEALLYVDRARAKPRYVLATFPLVAQSASDVEPFSDPSAAADARRRRIAEARTLDAVRRSVLSRAKAALEKTERLLEALDRDEAATEGADRSRELAESLLAQVSSARRVEGGLAIVDYYHPQQAEVVVEADRNETPQEIAERLFAFHRKAKRTREEVSTRRRETERRRDALAALVERAGGATSPSAVAAVDDELDAMLGVRKTATEPRGGRSAKNAPISGVRRFLSSDDYEIFVGRSSAANDALTFKVAKSTDLWLHAADYPGSHVVVRNPTRGDVPHRTILEAAQLAAFYSEAREDRLVEVRYTPRKFVSKPKGAPPGLVRISTFKTVAVAPSADLDRIR